MATSKTSNTYNRQNWEDAEFPILCQTCLGDNPYIRMTKEKYGKECKICSRPFTVFRWNPGAKMRFKKTEVCQTCSRIKNVCQTCLLDLEYGLPIQVRDAALRIKDDLPRSEINKEYYVQNLDRDLGKADPTTPTGAVGKSQAASDLLLKLARTTPYYKRNRPHICSFWVKGECKRGEECPYRHEKPTDPEDPLADQNIKDRYYGVNDPVAEKLMRRAESMPKLEPPEDKTVTTLYVGNVSDRITEKELQDHFYQYGEIRSITVLAKQQCAFVQFTTRAAAELAAERTFNKLILCGRRMTIRWGRSQGRQNASAEEGDVDLEPVPGLPGTLPLPPEEVSNTFASLPQNIPFPSGMPPPFLLPPPMPRPPPGIRPPAPPLFFFPSHLRPPLVPPPGVQPAHFPQRPPAMYPSNTITSRVPADPGAPGTIPASGIHYPSQDPSRLGTTKKSWPNEE